MSRSRPALFLTLAIAAATVVQSGAAGTRVDPQVARHVLNRITFGPSAEALADIEQTGIEGYITRQLHPERIDDAGVTKRLSTFETLHLSSRALAEHYEIPAMQARRERQQAAAGKPADPPAAPPQPADAERQHANLPLLELGQQKIIRAVYSNRQLEEVLTDFWFNHFNVDARKGPTRFMLTEYERDVIRPHVLGHFRDLLGATAKSPAMLFYLDNWMSADPNGPHPERAQADARRFNRMGQPRRNRIFPAPPPMPRNVAQARRQPSGLNENYGRELLELHTLGVDGGYTQKDVTEVARAFTGWTIQTPRLGGGYRFAPALHDDGEKIVLGHRIKAGGGEHDGEEVLDILASHPSTARFISTKLARRFVSDNPPAALIDRMAATFRKSDGDLRAVMTVLLTSKEFLAPDAEDAKVKNPFEFLASALRATNADVADARPLVRSLQQLGMPLYQCQPPTGYKDNADTWVNTGALVNRMNVALTLASGRMPGISVPDISEPELLAGDNISETTRATIGKAQAPAQRIALALGSPEFQRR